jgi:ATP-dependent Clp protease ATP-binding subunit ClpC
MMERELEALRKEKEAAVTAQEFEKAAGFRDKERRLSEEIEKSRNEWQKRRNNEEPIVDSEQIAQIVAEWTGIPVVQLTEEESSRLLRMEEEIHKRMVDQEEAVNAVARSIRRARSGLKDPKRPIGSFLFLGPTGVGKTELARSLAEFLFGGEDAMVRFDMSEYMERHEVAKLIGAPPGYVGYEEGGKLTEALRRRPYSVVLFDEIEKAHPDVFNILLQILEDGRLTDGQGHTVDFRNSVVIMTSNVGAQDLMKSRSLGFTAVDGADVDLEKMKSSIMEAVRKTFRPEFINRVDDIIIFKPLGKEELLKILDIMLDEVSKRLEEQGITIDVPAETRQKLLIKGYDPKFGARPLRRTLQKTIEDPLADLLLEGKVERNSVIRVTVEGDNFSFKTVEKKKDVGQSGKTVANTEKTEG